jgi:hypothetical protein
MVAADGMNPTAIGAMCRHPGERQHPSVRCAATFPDATPTTTPSTQIS